MTKSEFVDKVASTSGLSKKDADNAVNAVIKTIEDSLKSGDDVNFTGFGKFHVAERGAREGRNPRTGESMTIAASRVPASWLMLMPPSWIPRNANSPSGTRRPAARCT